MAGFGFGFGGARRRSANGGGSPALLPVGLTWTWLGDGLVSTSGGAGTGITNAPHQFARLIGGRAQPCPVPILGRSGSTIARDISSNRAWVKPYAIDAAALQVPSILIGGTMGANDNLLSADPGANPASGQTTNVYLQDWYDAFDYAYAKFVAYGGYLLVWIGTAASDKAGETTIDSGQSLDRRTRVWAAQAAHVAAVAAVDSRVLFISLAAMLPMSEYSVDGSNHVHLDERGAYYIANAAFQAIDARIAAATADQIADLIDAGTYPLMTAVNLDTATALPGTAGTVTGPGVTGTIATGKTITNTTGVTGITVEQVATNGGRTKTRVTLAGTASATGKVMIADSANQSVAAKPGQPVCTGAIIRYPTGIHNMGADWGGNFGTWGGTGGSLANNALVGAGETHTVDALVFFNPMTPFGSSGPFAGARRWAALWRSGTTLSGTIEFERPFTWIPSNRTAAVPVYLGEIQDSAGNLILSTNYRMRPTGSFSASTGGTIRVEPGTWNLFGLTETDYAARRVYRGGSGGLAGLGTGTLMATLSGANWTVNPAAQGTAGELIYVEIDCNNGVGGTVTYRSVLTVTIGA
jgi:hypothetical protein